jgi:hypothetical protein
MKHIVYKYGGDQSDEMDFDAHGLLTFAQGDILSRRGMTWKIDAVEKEVDDHQSLSRMIPTYWIYLSRVLVN